MYTLVNILHFLVNIGILAIFGAFVWKKWQEDKPKRNHRANKSRLSKEGGLDKDDQLSDEEAKLAVRISAKHNLELFGVPDVEAGGHLLHVPCINPEKEGWEDNREIISTSRINGFSRSGKITTELIELNNGYVLLATGNNVSILKKYKLTISEEKELEKQRRDAVTKNDGVIESFLGQEWSIKKAYGDNFNRSPGEKKCSYIQVLSLHPKLEDGDYQSILPPDLCDGKEHDYYDMRAISDDERLLFFFYAAGSWTCYIGRKMEKAEVDQISGI